MSFFHSRFHSRFSLRVYITSMFTALIILLGAVLIYAQHRHNSAFLLAGSEYRLDVLKNRLSRQLEHELSNIHTGLTLMRSNGVTLATSEQDPARWWPLLHPLLTANPQVTAFYVGESDGRILAFRMMRDQQVRTAFAAPETADLMMVIMAPDSAARRFYFDQAYRMVDETEVHAESFDSRTRPWFAPSLAQPDLHITPPYHFHSSQVPGITLSLGDAGQQRVWAADLLLRDLDAQLKLGLPEARTLLLQAPAFQVLASSQPDSAPADTLPDFHGLKGFEILSTRPDLASWEVELDGDLWLGQQTPLTLTAGSNSKLDLRLSTLIPYRKLMANALDFGRTQTWLTLLIVALSLPVVIMASRAISRPLRQMAEDLKGIQEFDFNGLKARHYFYRELDALARAITLMHRTLAGFIQELRSLSQSDDFNDMLQRLSQGIQHLSGGQRCLVYRARQQEHAPCLVLLDKEQQHQVPLPDKAEPDELSALLLQSLEGHGLRFEPPWLLYDRFGKLNGAIVLGLGYGAAPLSAGKRRFISHYSEFANLALEDMTLFEQQQQMTESMIRVIASAIDAKSPYTSGHCQRVPELTLMLARAAHHSDTGNYADFRLSEREWEALYLASWLHDCGKVVTPEHVIDKATKLETIYNRLHEIRMRFEVLKRDADIDYWQGRAGGEDEPRLASIRAEQHRQLDEDFAFIANLNQGGETVNQAQLERLNRIAERRWLRTLDNTLGLSWEEQQRRGNSEPVPAWEPLLADKPWHRIPYPARERIDDDNPWQITLVQPELKLDLGECHNLSIARGTLTPEERYTINAHMVHTLIMLSELHYPDHLSDVPMLAAGHHERMDGRGYPRSLKAGELPLQARMMALADVFEALTAADRPYKQPKRLSEALTIMAAMVRKQHLDPGLFRFFVEQELYLQYGHRFLAPGQLDPVNKQQILELMS
ncbi:HD-GYP domain-containing protein (c-di-GMP phosphodiesterase class II) [Oceanisphaera litoralis]|uniref:HD domain-containing phosphohydrolase n=1 Tax=Oceanisphaera litoralis TaxID=225144 RepID=UPI00195C7E50|nr:HD domain-containing phosphohydrolase [Oceanisphaera litoralis]MBM7454810.1 HD-GYP domain-containing protein (c-di-GMP phosphodiesterase class II) [Oceanisphaera litoralis]